MNDKNELIEYLKTAGEVLIEMDPLGNFILKTYNKQSERIFNERVETLVEKVDNLEFFMKKLDYLMNDNCKYIHVRNFLSLYFTKADPALTETNVKIFLDYVNEKSISTNYDNLLNKICLLNKESLNVLRKIKGNIREDNYYEWKEFIQLYPNINSKLSFRDIFTSKELTEEMLEITFGLKTLIENDFIISMSGNYLGNIDVYDVEKFSLTNLGYLILNYVDL